MVSINLPLRAVLPLFINRTHKRLVSYAIQYLLPNIETLKDIADTSCLVSIRLCFCGSTTHLRVVKKIGSETEQHSLVFCLATFKWRGSRCDVPLTHMSVCNKICLCLCRNVAVLHVKVLNMNPLHI